MQSKKYTEVDYKTILASIGEGIIVIDRHQKIVFINKATEYMLGWKARDFIGKTWQDDIPVVCDKDGKQLSSNDLPMQKVLISDEMVATSSYFFSSKRQNIIPSSSHDFTNDYQCKDYWRRNDIPRYHERERHHER